MTGLVQPGLKAKGKKFLGVDSGHSQAAVLGTLARRAFDQQLA